MNSPLPETIKSTEYSVPAGQEIEMYQAISTAHELEVARAVGVFPMGLSYRVYGERVMWRLTCAFPDGMPREEVKMVLFKFVVRVFGAYKPEYFKPDDASENAVVVVWFTNGANLALQNAPVEF